MNSEQYYTIDQIAEKFGKTPRTVYSWMSQRVNPLKFGCVGGTRVVKVVDFEKWANKQGEMVARRRRSA
mgnify:CR=1 FL=1